MMFRTIGRWSLTAAILVACVPPGGDEQPRTISRGDDLLGTGEQLFVADSVTGDVMLAGGELDFSGVAGGSYLGVGGEQEIDGRIAGSVRAAGGRVVVKADVARNVTLAGGEVEVDSGAIISHNAYLIGAVVRMKGAVDRELAMTGSEVVLDGAVGGDVDVSAKQLTVGPHARITGSLRHSVSTGRVFIDPGARIAGGITALPAPVWEGFGRIVRSIWLIGFLVVGLVVVALFPRVATAAAASTRERAGVSVAFGAAWLFGLPVAIALAAVTIIGLPLAAIGMAVYLILAYLGRAAIAVWLGELVLRRWTSFRNVSPVATFLLGGVLLVVLSLLPVVGGFVGFVATLMGVGALLVAVWPRKQAVVSG